MFCWDTVYISNVLIVDWHFYTWWNWWYNVLPMTNYA